MDLFSRLENIPVRDLDEIRVILGSLREACKVAGTQISGVLEYMVVNKGQTEGLEPDLVRQIHVAALQRSARELGGIVIDLSQLTSTPTKGAPPFAKPPNISS